MKMIAEERHLRKFLWDCYLPSYLGKRKIGGRITAFKYAVEEKCAERAFAEYLRMFGDSKQNIVRAGQIVAVIRSRK